MSLEMWIFLIGFVAGLIVVGIAGSVGIVGIVWLGWPIDLKEEWWDIRHCQIDWRTSGRKIHHR